MSTLQLIISTLFNLYIMVVLMRIWLQLARADFYNPLSQFTVKVTNPIVAPLRRVIPSFGKVDTASLVLAFVLVVLKMTLLTATLGQLSLAFMANLIPWCLLGLVKQIGYLIFWVLLLRAILSWVSQGRSPIEYVASQLCEPLLAPIRRVVPPIGGLDLSIMILSLTLIVINSFMIELFGSFIILSLGNVGLWLL